MAYIYMMAVECENETQCRGLASWWEQHKVITLSSGEQITCDIEVSNYKSSPGDAVYISTWWFIVYPRCNKYDNYARRLCSGGPSSIEEAQEINELTKIFYDLLRQRSDFRFGAADFEVADFNDYEDLIGYSYLDGNHSNIIISNEMWEKMKKPVVFQKFSESHMWIANKEVVYEE
jgi:hypothetical protein